MDLADAKVIKQGNSLHVQHGDDSGLYVEFSLEPVQDKEKSLAEGRPIFKDREYITIRILGDKSTVRKRPVKYEADGGVPADTDRFYRQYQAFKNANSVVSDGTPITEWPPITKSQAMELKALNIHTVEALASCGDNNLTWLGARTLRDQAKAWIERAKSGAGDAKIAEENEFLRNELQAMKNQLAALQLNADKPKRGRPAKEVDNGEDVPSTDPASGE